MLLYVKEGNSCKKVAVQIMIEIFIAFGAGLLSFLSPCVLPLIPGYISYVSGSSLNELLEKKEINLIPTILFVFGFSLC